MKLLGTQSTKTLKGEAFGYLTGILYLAPHKRGGKNICPHASRECIALCLNTSGRGVFDAIQTARLRKTSLFHENRAQFVETLALDIVELERKASREGLIPCVRLNGTSDLPWENLGGKIGVNLMYRFPGVIFYDYTKNVKRALDAAKGNFPQNYKLTFSRAEDNDDECRAVLYAGGNVAVVFENENFPKTYGGKRVVNGDEHDLRFLDPKNKVIALKAKGKAKVMARPGGFVLPV